MAIAGNRSPSPSPNSRINSNIRNSEINSPMRKSFVGNPFPRPSRTFVPPTPANSPADFPSRNFSTKEEKENEKDHHTIKHMKARSPSVPKATNHFMIPTISAASKINPSPRKKVLADRNEPIRNSLSLSPFGSANFSDDTQDFDKKQVNAVSDTPFNPIFSPKVSNIAPLDADPSIQPYDPKTNYLSPRPQFLHYRPNPRLELYYQEQGSETKNLEDSFLRESFSSESEVSEGSEAESSNKEFENGSSVEGISEIAQIEAEDASSVEVFNNKDEAEVPKLELISKDTEVFEGSEAQDVSPVEAITVNSQNEPIASLASIQVSDTESEDSSLIDIVSKEDEPKISEPDPITNPISTHVSKEETSEEKREVKSQLFKRRKFPLLLFLLIACFAVSFMDSPISSAPAYEKFSSSKFYEKLSSSKFYEKSLNDVARNMKLWSVYSTSYVNELISSFSGVEKLGPMQFSNLTYNQEDPFIHTKRVEKIFEQDEVENVFEDEDEFERLLEETLENDDQNIGRERDFDVVSDLPKSLDFEERSLRLEAVEFIPKEAEMVKEDDETYTSEIAENSEIVLITTAPSFGNTFEYTPQEVESMIVEGDHVYNSDTAETMGNTFDNHLVSDSDIVSSFKNTLGKESSQVDPEYNCERSEIGEIKYDGPLVSESETEPTKVEPDFENTLNMDDSTLGHMPNNESSKRYKTLAISLLVIALLAAPFLMYLKNKNANTHKATGPISTKKWTKSNTTPQSYSPESEMSSFDGSVSYSKGYTWGITNEAQSQERKQKRVLKRESLASSSGFSVSDSPSYGSFTTYERLQSKHGYGEDEATPVRRSSRIKKIQVTSP